ncbi:hypothetical protein [Streptomyces sp. NPDC056480]|uniref:hypothetical protein n=1 Tax=Streptomyces sp. NPDC056480 TaxID=3345833 RepID=UPI003682390C
MLQLGYAPVSGRSVLTWTFTRLLLMRGDPDLRAIRLDDLTALAEEIKRYCARPEAGFVRASHVSNARRRMPMDQLAEIYQKACLTRLHGVHVLLFNIGQVPEPPFHGLKTTELWRTELTLLRRRRRSPPRWRAGFRAGCRPATARVGPPLTRRLSLLPALARPGPP